MVGVVGLRARPVRSRLDRISPTSAGAGRIPKPGWLIQRRRPPPDRLSERPATMTTPKRSKSSETVRAPVDVPVEEGARGVKGPPGPVGPAGEPGDKGPK